jgi:leucyl aminopeptidase
MKFQTSALSNEPLKSDLVIYVTTEAGIKKINTNSTVVLPSNLKSLINQSLSLDNFKDEKSKILLFQFPDAQISRLLICKIDVSEENLTETIRKNSGKAYPILAGQKVSSCHLVVDVDEIEPEMFIQSWMEGWLLKKYKYSDLKSAPDKSGNNKIGKIVFLLPENKKTRAIKRTVVQTESVIEGVNFARRLGDTPGNLLTPNQLARDIRNRFKSNNDISIKVLTEPEIKKLKMNAFLAVSQGSKEPPRLIMMHYRSKKKSAKHLLLVGKGVTFDSGGISIKPSAKMEEMKFDMCGAAAVAGLLDAASGIKPDVNITGIIPAAENLPDAAAVKPGDVVKAYNGKTIEIINTDAEGRLLLADSLAYGIKKYRPDYVIDLATLTGSVVVALGSHASGLFSNNGDLAKLLIRAGQQSGERVWELPIWDDYKTELDSPSADMKNVGGREAGSISAAKFLQEFVGDIPWAHLDIAGTAYEQNHLPYLNKGASGVGVRLLMAFLNLLTAKGAKAAKKTE